ncbi:MAG: ribonuclease R [Sumerlaeia bacterium]
MATRPPARPRPKAFRGRLQVTRSGAGFVRLEGPTSVDIFVKEDDQGDALDGDVVLVTFLKSTSKSPIGRIVKVVERATTTVVGLYQRIGAREGEVQPRNTSLNRRVLVPLPPPELGVNDWEFVVAEITRYTPPGRPLNARIIERLGPQDEQGMDVLLLLRDRGMVAEFPASVEAAAAKLELDIESELPRRRDLRKLTTATIDPATAKDFDDALSIERIDGQHWRLYVHIADVSHYVRPDDPIDREAQHRCTSVYPVDRVVPMLPEKLCNDLCSLKPQVDRLALTAEMVVDRQGRVHETDFYSSIIHSNQRLTYEQAQAIITEAEDAEKERFADVVDDIFQLCYCARALREERHKRGALDLDIPEATIVFKAGGEVDDLAYRKRFEAHMLVEDCMLAANEAVARFLTKHSAPMLYRIHESADAEKLERLQEMLKVLGVRLPVQRDGLISQRDVQVALKDAEKIEGGHIIRRLVLRALKRAEYNRKNKGHFGLASKCYCHFTSPIRRYPDVVVHRQTRAIERKEPLPYPNNDEGQAVVDALAQTTSMREREAQDAEMESMRIKSLEYIKQFEGDEFQALVSGVAPYGMYVELQPSGVEGLIPAKSIRGDRFDMDDLGVALVGEYTGKVYKLTDKITVRIVRASPMEQRLDLSLVTDEEDGEAGDDGGPKKPPKWVRMKQGKR